MKQIVLINYSFLLCIFLTPISSVYAVNEENLGGGADMKLTSDKFQNNEMIPKKYTCVGEDINPPFDIQDIPQRAQSLVLIADDPDATKGIFTHWVAYDISLISQIKENSAPGTVG